MPSPPGLTAILIAKKGRGTADYSIKGAIYLLIDNVPLGCLAKIFKDEYPRLFSNVLRVLLTPEVLILVKKFIISSTMVIN